MREFPPVKPFCVQWDGRALFEVSQHDASKKKKAGGRPSDHNEKDLGDQKMTATQWQKECETERGIGRARFSNF